jgi:formamidase
MLMQNIPLESRVAQDVIHVDTFTAGLIGPSVPMLGPVKNGGTIVTGTAPGCWGPMITPKFQGGHEVTQPVAVEGAKVGDAIAVKLKRVEVTSLATSSGVMQVVDGRYVGDPFVAKLCPKCGMPSPSTHLEGIGQQAVHCDACGTEMSAFRMTNGYVIVFDRDKQVAVTVTKEIAERIARDAGTFAALPAASEQHSILAFAQADIV